MRIQPEPELTSNSEQEVERRLSSPKQPDTSPRVFEGGLSDKSGVDIRSRGWIAFLKPTGRSASVKHNQLLANII
jgi:hypothetical protein